MDNETIWTTKNPEIEYDTIWITHSDIEPVRIYASNGSDQPVAIGGYSHDPCYIEVQYPQVDGESASQASFSMQRAVVGDEVKRLLKSITPYKRIKEPVKVVLARWHSSDLSTPMFSYELDVANDGVSFSVDSVTVKCEKTNIMTRSVARVYEITEWTGLENT